MKKLKNNKGVAFVTVLIAITFISILAVSLLYMAYLNYLTKSLRTKSNDNFYTGEFSVDEVAANLQQTAANVKGKGGISEAKIAIANKVGSTVTKDTGTGTYDPTKVTQLVKVTNSDPNTTVVVTSANPVYIAKANSVELKNLCFTTTDANGYTSTIYTDMTVQFQSTPPGDYDINDFSVISDSILSVEKSGGSSNYSGCIYIKQTKGSSYALLNDKGALVSLLCPVGIIDGDVRITKSSSGAPSALSIAGNVMVRGDVYIDSGCSLAVSGKLQVSGKIENNGNIVGEKNKNYITGVDLSAIPTEGLAGSVFAKHLYLFSFKDNGGPCPRIFDIAESSLADIPHVSERINNGYAVKDNLTFVEDKKTYTYPIVTFTRQGGLEQRVTTDTKNPYYPANSSSEYYGAKINLPDQKFNGKDAELIMTCSNIYVENSVRGSTMLTLGNISTANDGEVTMTKMTKDGYIAAKEALWCYSDYDMSKNHNKVVQKIGLCIPTESGTCNAVGGDWRDFCEAMCSGDWVVYSYDVNAANSISSKPLIGTSTGEQKKKEIKNMEQLVYVTDSDGNILDVNGNIWKSGSKTEKAIAISTDDATRYLVFQSSNGSVNSDWTSSSFVGKGNTQITVMVPYGYFLSSNTSATVSKYVSSTTTADNPDLTTVRYDNWYKE